MSDKSSKDHAIHQLHFALVEEMNFEYHAVKLNHTTISGFTCDIAVVDPETNSLLAVFEIVDKYNAEVKHETYWKLCQIKNEYPSSSPQFYMVHIELAKWTYYQAQKGEWYEISRNDIPSYNNLLQHARFLFAIHREKTEEEKRIEDKLIRKSRKKLTQMVVVSIIGGFLSIIIVPRVFNLESMSIGQSTTQIEKEEILDKIENLENQFILLNSLNNDSGKVNFKNLSQSISDLEAQMTGLENKIFYPKEAIEINALLDSKVQLIELQYKQNLVEIQEKQLSLSRTQDILMNLVIGTLTGLLIFVISALFAFLPRYRNKSGSD